MTATQFDNLTPTQERLMEYLRGGHRARRTYLTVIEINGRPVCREATMRALEKRGLVRQVGDDEDEWEASKP